VEESQERGLGAGEGGGAGPGGGPAADGPVMGRAGTPKPPSLLGVEDWGGGWGRGASGRLDS